MGKSATVLGKPYYMNGRQFNFLLYQQGFLEGNPGAWELTPKGEQFAEIRDYHRGTGGYAHYNRYWSEIIWKDEIVEHLNLSVKAQQWAIDAEKLIGKMDNEENGSRDFHCSFQRLRRLHECNRCPSEIPGRYVAGGTGR